MGYNFEDKAWEDYKNAEKKDKKKIDGILKEIRRGKIIAHAEALKHELTGYYSARINDKDRLIYRLKGETVMIISCRGHYGDK
ncbi:MAG: Txe/YoeB family addiction module toxin [Oscillospiraceae bacterium]|nr:Txe/YoeB family addiction module toxin [Oscillospiraceae bacterium]